MDENEIEEEYFFPEEITDQENTIIEGGYKQITVNAYERDNKARGICLQKYGYTCQICGQDKYLYYEGENMWFVEGLNEGR